MGTDQWGPCVDSHRLNGALEHPLNATVKHDNYAVYITNNESKDWYFCAATLDNIDPSADNYQSDGFAVTPGQTKTIPWRDMTNKESIRFNYSQIKPNSLDLICTVGGHINKDGLVTGDGEEHGSRYSL
jgi:hypothetical protein